MKPVLALMISEDGTQFGWQIPEGKLPPLHVLSTALVLLQQICLHAASQPPPTNGVQIADEALLRMLKRRQGG